jgi:hypothetical protein
VLVGRFCKGHSGLVVPAFVPGGVGARYDSMVDNVERPNVVVSGHNDNQALPAFVVKFERIGGAFGSATAPMVGVSGLGAATPTPAARGFSFGAAPAPAAGGFNFGVAPAPAASLNFGAASTGSKLSFSLF